MGMNCDIFRPVPVGIDNAEWFSGFLNRFEQLVVETNELKRRFYCFIKKILIICQGLIINNIKSFYTYLAGPA